MMSVGEIKHLRAKTGAGILDCKKALEESGQDFGKALDWLKKKGLARAEKSPYDKLKKEKSLRIYMEMGVLVSWWK